MWYKPYIKTYTLFLVVASIALAIASYLLGDNISGGLSWASLVLPILCAIGVGQTFVIQERRIPSEDEKNVLIKKSFLVYILLNLCVEGLYLLLRLVVIRNEGLSVFLSMRTFLICTAMIIVFWLQYTGIRWAYGGMLNKNGAKMLEKLNSSKH